MNSIFAQEPITSEVISRVVNIFYNNKQGTGFFIEHNGKACLVTAKHILKPFSFSGVKNSIT
ncbi:MAG: hypothetical protein L3J20_11660 [Flavobacteriaceae bacterium]|nr:hypothetical protein [Flavobacteriaceae bacterium]